MTEPGLADVLREVETLHGEIKREGQEISGRWRDWIGRENFVASAKTLPTISRSAGATSARCNDD